ncbi:MAG: DUF1593 domain-containing protein [Bacteroidales bacterium]
MANILDNDLISQVSSNQGKPRIVITADPELDDNNSLIRFLLYSSDLEIEGLVYASSGYHWKGDGKGTKWYVPGREYARFGLDLCPCESWRWAENERFIHNAVEAYEKVYPNLKIHNQDYPAPALLKSRIRYGNIEFDGEISKDSPGSELIKSLILDDKPGKLFVTAWGGQSTIARALKSIQEQFEYTVGWDQLKEKISRKVVILPSGDQDDTYALYIKPNWPGIESRHFTEGPSYSYGAQLFAKKADSIFMTPSWMKENVTSRGALGSIYRVWGDGKQMVKGDKMDYFGLSGYTSEELKKMGYLVWMPVQTSGSWLGEGDTFTYMNMLGNGLRAFEDGTYGGWGGRQVKGNAISFQLSDTSAAAMSDAITAMSKKSGDNTREQVVPDFFPAAQNDFAARMKWSVTSQYSKANHEPVVKIEGPLLVLVHPGDKIRLNGSVTDPDGDQVSVIWWQFRVGTFSGKLSLTNQLTNSVSLTVPKDAKQGETIHLVFEATDNGAPSLTRYQRVILSVN